MSHSLLIGMTESGKTTLARKLAVGFKRRAVPVVVLDPMRDPRWDADEMFTDPQEFISYLRDPSKCLRVAAFIDESGMVLDKYERGNQWLTCQSRHHGHRVHLIAQRAEMVDINLRENCRTAYVFNIAADTAKIYSRSFNCPAILKAPNLPRGMCIVAQRFGKPRLLNVFDD